jgi:hypothetical protein
MPFWPVHIATFLSMRSRKLRKSISPSVFGGAHASPLRSFVRWVVGMSRSPQMPATVFAVCLSAAVSRLAQHGLKADSGRQSEQRLFSFQFDNAAALFSCADASFHKITTPRILRRIAQRAAVALQPIHQPGSVPGE